MLVRIGLLVLAGIICSLLISCGSADTTPQPNLYTLEDALTLAAQTLQAESRVATPSKTPTPAAKADVSNEQTESEENPEEPVVPVTGGNDEETDLSGSGDNGERSAQSPETASGGEKGNGDSDQSKSIKSDRQIDTVDPSKIESFQLGGFTYPEYCSEYICPGEKVDLKQFYLKNIGPLPPPTNIGRCGTSGDCEEKKEKGSDDTGEEPPPAPIEIPPLPPITLPGQPPLPPFPPPIFP